MKTLPKIAFVLFCLYSFTLVLHAQVPSQINYQGRVVVGTTNFDGSGQFKFALVDAAGTTTYWSNDGTSVNGSQPTNAVTLTVTKGLYSVLLGDNSITNMTALPGSVFNNADVRLRVWFNNGVVGSQLLTPDQRLGTVGYAFMADNIKDGAVTSAKLGTGAVGATNIANGAVGSTQLASGLTLAGITAGTFSGGGSALTSLNASNITTGTLPAAQLPTTVALRAGGNNFTGKQTLTGNGSEAQIQAATAGNSSYLEFDDSTGGTVSRGILGVDGPGFTGATNQFTIASWTNSPLAFYTNQARRMTILSNGNVGIGTSTPTSALEIAGTVKGTFNGDGSALTNLNASSISAGTLPAAQLPATVALRAGGNDFTGNQTFTGIYNFVTVQSANAGLPSYLSFVDSTGGTVSRFFVGLDAVSGLGTNEFDIGTSTTSPLVFYTDGFRKMTILSNGNVGIGTATPANKLDVAGSANFTGSLGVGLAAATHGRLEVADGPPNTWTSGNIFPGFSSANTNGFLSNFSAQTGNAAIYANGNVVTTGYFFAISDERVKNIIGRSDAARDLNTLLGIEITDYRYKDVIVHGDAPSKKVIAQQVEKVFPQAVNRQTGEVPDIYQLATINDGWIALATDLKKGERVKLIADETQGVYEVLEVRGGGFRTDFKSATEKVFVYGREVKDFRNVDYDAIAMLNVSATQEMQREIEALKASVLLPQKQLADLKKEAQSQLAVLRNENATLRAENAANAKRLATLETRDKEREARLTRIEISLPAAQPVANTIASSKAGGQ